MSSAAVDENLPGHLNTVVTNRSEGHSPAGVVVNMCTSLHFPVLPQLASACSTPDMLDYVRLVRLTC